MQNASAERLLELAKQRLQANDNAGASSLINQALAVDPDNIRGLAFGAALASSAGQKDLALSLAERALKLGPEVPLVIGNAAHVFFRCGKPDRAQGLYERIVELYPRSAEAHENLAYFHYVQDDVTAAEKSYRKVMELEPRRRRLHLNLGFVLKRSGRIEEAVSVYREGARLFPEDITQSSNYLYSLNYDPSKSPEQIHAEHSAWGQRLEAAIPCRSDHGNDRSPDRRLRVGYVSPHLRDHVVGHYLLPLFRKHDHSQFEIHCYSDTGPPDEMTGRLREHSDVWHDTAGLTDAQLADLVSRDRIDVLVDLVMHMDGGRLGMFARKPAPVQVAWLAYPSSTGLTRMDYRFTDAALDPPGATDHLYSEQSVRLETYWCFEAPAGSPEIGPLPVHKNGYFTFGCLNNFCKINRSVLDAWREVLAAVPESRLMIMPPKGGVKDWVLKKLRIDPSRLVCLPRASRTAYLDYYNRVDLALDPFPYTGHTTTLDGLWMGVSLVSLASPTVVSRGSLSILSNVGLADLAVKNKNDYVALAIALAKDLPRLRDLRAGLRGRMERSVLMDADRFARQMETAYRKVWQKWCGTGSIKF